MKKFTENTISPNRSKSFRPFLTLFWFFSMLSTTLLSFQSFSQNRFTNLEKTITLGVLQTFKKECGYNSSVNASKTLEIQNIFKKNKTTFDRTQTECFDQYLGQIVGAQNIYQSLCDEITQKVSALADKDIARLFVNVRKFESGIHPYHEKLNECLIRGNVNTDLVASYSNFEKNSKILSQKIKETDTNPPFQENRVDFR